MTTKTLNEQARELAWGPTIEQPKNEKEALDYIIRVLGDQTRSASLGEIYALKMLRWMQARAAMRAGGF